ncbi:MAG: hypothetical protein HKN40_04300 [Winogradskyella sp.]|uniref:DUF7793 family protein n=1 Tax=Winogradskyella sp. TaxID=1883156 RepID=UPI001823903F|nr:hypothetical protein [Winogradskyella sp.]
MNNTLLIEFDTVKFWTEHGILFCQILNTKAIKLNAKERLSQYVDAIYTLSEGKPIPFIIDMQSTLGTFSTEIAKLLADSPALNKIRLCEAFVSNSINTTLLVHSYKRIYESETPYRIFKDFETAKQYCLTYKDDL